MGIKKAIIKRRGTSSMGSYMAEQKEISRWMVVIIFITGIFCGVCLATVFMWLAVL